ncbi:hypothetical protein [Actinophytocola gossypii]|uniref:DUF3558 domain-containing protein n=1 Tax=Actinophytocola gossypii TaxID=2812003 RepID=A0ABT2JIV1_9PSEU|nr:hypothetical protein [Actinophytocola gossypii]MCT2587819.1 hypothetical protein [Actinophytocola gossypii]
MSRTVLACLVALVLTGCSTGVAGSPAGEQRASGPLTAENAFGDLRRIDPCSLTGPFAFEEHGEARMPAKVTMDECLVTVDVDGDEVVVELGLLQHVDALPSGREEVAALDGNASIVRVPTQVTSNCVMALVFADDVAVSTTAEPELVDTVPKETLCALARAGAEGIAEAARTNLVRHWEPPTNSLARVSACGLLPPDQVANLLGIEPERVNLYPSEHQCRWGVPGGSTPTAKLDFEVGADPGKVGVAHRTPAEDIAGRGTWLVPTDTSNITVCTVVTEHIPFALQEGEREYAVIRVAAPTTTGADACGIGRELATVAWTKLPAAG